MRLDFLLVFFRRVAQGADVFMTEEGVAVEGNLGVEDPQVAVGHDDQRVDLEQRHVLLDEGLVEDREERGSVFAGGPFELQRVGKRNRVGSRDARRRIDGDGDDLFRRIVRDGLDVHAAFGRNDESNLTDGTVDEDREIEFAVDVGAVFDVETVDLLAGRAGLLGHQRVAEHILGVGDDIVNRLGKANATLGVRAEFLELALAAATGVDLALDDVKRARKLLGGSGGFVGGEDGNAVRDGCAIALQQSLGLIFMNVHGLIPVMTRKLLQRRRDRGASVAEAGNGSDRLVESFLLGLVEIDFDDALDTACTDDGGNADIHVLDAILAVEVSGARQNALLVLEVGFSHLNGRGSRSVIGRAGLQQADDFGAAVTGALDDFFEALGGEPAHLDEIGERNAGNGGVASKRNHRVAVATKNESGDVLDGNVEFLGKEEAEARAVKHACHADNLVGRQARELLQRPDHGVERVGDADHESIRGILLDAGADLLHDLEVDAEKVVAAHARLAGNACRDDADVSAFDRGIVAGAGEISVKAFDRRRLGDVETLALGDAVRDVEQDDVAQFLQAGEMRQRATNHARTNKCDLVARHFGVSFAIKIRGGTPSKASTIAANRIDPKGEIGN
ncbi:hypothetical protein RHSP_59721 [Rhizobium freirei PRF 81]|uniref:NAD-specific glutamate dehydrogenase n=1 Tax=Rhizobium freirei PRF 81 TaxID=363754 RepID=N6V8V2_9HYPH|nr:hypothetical protein RHSP_59721 [Rhizobium freirei PRF 81]